MSQATSRICVVGYLILCGFVTAALSLMPAAADENSQPPSSDKEISNLIIHLGDVKFATREKAQHALILIGKPAVEALHKADRDTTDLEIRLRARQILDEIDPGWAARAKLVETRAALLKVIEEVRGVDIRNWGESVTNPFRELTAEGKKRLTAAGIDVARLQKMRARYLSGIHSSAPYAEFVNKDPDTVVVVGKGFRTHFGLSSAGPVLAVEDAYFASPVRVANLLWFVDRAQGSTSILGAPVLAAESAEAHRLQATPGVLVGDYGWHQPKDFLKAPSEAEAKNDPPLTKELERDKKELVELIKEVKALDISVIAEPVTNPFVALTEEGKLRLKYRGIDPERLAKLKAVCLDGNSYGIENKELVNNDPDTILVIGKGLQGTGQIYSLGPVLVVDKTGYGGSVTGADLVWFVDRSAPYGYTTGVPLVVAPTVSQQNMHPKTKYIWLGDYGWRQPANFLKPPTAEEAKNFHPPTTELAEARKELAARVKKAKAANVLFVAGEIANPFTELSEESKIKLRLRAIDPDRLSKLKAIYLTGEFHGFDVRDFVNNDPDTILVIGKGFFTSGRVYSMGPILVVGNLSTRDVVGADLIWYADKSYPWGKTTGAPVILAPGSRHLRLEGGTKFVWQGDFGWRPPEGFPAQGKAGADKKK